MAWEGWGEPTQKISIYFGNFRVVVLSGFLINLGKVNYNFKKLDIKFGNFLAILGLLDIEFLLILGFFSCIIQKYFKI